MVVVVMHVYAVVVKHKKHFSRLFVSGGNSIVFVVITMIPLSKIHENCFKLLLNGNEIV